MKTNGDPTAHPVNYERLIVTVTEISKVFLYLVIEFSGQSGVATKETKVKVNKFDFILCIGSPFGNSVASALEGSSAKSAAAGFQSSPAKVMVTGRDQLRVKLPPKPSSHDWCPVKTSGTMEELVQVTNSC